LIYFSSDSCSACDSVFPLLKAKLKKYPDVAAGKADVEKVLSVAGVFGETI
jgi:protein-disulfide isomerase